MANVGGHIHEHGKVVASEVHGQECHASEQHNAVLNRIDPDQRLTFFTGVLSRAGAPQATAQSAAVDITMAMVQVEVSDMQGLLHERRFFPAQTLETSFSRRFE
jgi:hypothetical protein